MPERITAPKLNPGDLIRVIAPSFSAAIFRPELLQRAERTLGELGLKTSYGKNVNQIDDFRSSPVESRVDDIHDAFEDPDVNGILTVIGGWSANQLLQYLDYDLIKANPKVLCGFSDVDALINGVNAKTGIVTYSGPHHIFFGQKKHFEYTKEHFERATMYDEPFDLEPSLNWSDDDWANHQDERNLRPNPGLKVIQDGTAIGRVVGGNLNTLGLLRGTDYMPDLDEVILFLEEAKFSNPHQVDRDLQALLQQRGIKIKGLVMGRFQPDTMGQDQIEQILRSKKELRNIPIITGADFGHTDPKGTIPVGGTARITASGDKAKIEFLEH